MKTKKTVIKKTAPRKTASKKVVAKNPVTMRTWVLFIVFLAVSAYSLRIIFAAQ